MRELGVKCPLYPDDAQRSLIEQTFGCSRVAYNFALACRKRAYDLYGVSLTTQDVMKLLPVLKNQRPYMKFVDATALQNAVRDNGRAFDAFFKNAREHRVVSKRKIKSGHVKNPHGYPRFKRKLGSRQSFRAQRVRSNIRVVDAKHVQLPKLGKVRFKLLREKMVLEGPCKILSATVSRDTCGRYWVSLQVRVPDAEQYTSGRAVMGIDAGVNSLMTRSDGVKEDNPRALRRYERKIKLANRALSRMRKDRERGIAEGVFEKGSTSKNYQKKKLELARLHQRVSDIRRDAIHKVTTKAVRKSQAIAVEDLNVKGMMSSHKSAKSIADASMSEMIRQLEYKCKWHGRGFVKVSRWYPSSKLCHVCGYKYDGLGRNETEWICPGCGVHHDRDWNAAINLEHEGTSLLATGGVGRTSP